MQRIPGAVDVHVHQVFSYPTLFLNVDRTRAQSVGLSQQDVANSLLLTLSSSAQITPSFWVNPATGFEYSVAVQVPQYQIGSMQNLENIPISSASPNKPQQLLSNLGASKPKCPALGDLSLQQPAYDRHLCLNRGTRPGRRRERHPENFEGLSGAKLPRGTQMEISGQVATMASSSSPG